jgi:hypothetical protein
MPAEGMTPMDDPDEPHLYFWLVLEHVVMLRKIDEEKSLYIIVVKPLE